MKKLWIRLLTSNSEPAFTKSISMRFLVSKTLNGPPPIPQAGHMPLRRSTWLHRRFNISPFVTRSRRRLFLNLLGTVASLNQKMIDGHGLTLGYYSFLLSWFFMINCQDVHFHMQKTRLNLWIWSVRRRRKLATFLWDSRFRDSGSGVTSIIFSSRRSIRYVEIRQQNYIVVLQKVTNYKTRAYLEFGTS